MRTLFQILRAIGDAKAIRRCPDAYRKRLMRRSAHRTLARLLRRL